MSRKDEYHNPAKNALLKDGWKITADPLDLKLNETIMDKINKYQQIICKTLAEYANIKKTITPNIKSSLIIDKENHHYQLVSIGWHKSVYVFTIAFHFSIINGKIWIQQNNTDAMIADELCEQGIPKTDIVLGFIAEKSRAFTGFATE